MSCDTSPLMRGSIERREKDHTLCKRAFASDESIIDTSMFLKHNIGETLLMKVPSQLLLDDRRSAVQTNSILSLVDIGCHWISEIAGRPGQPAGSLTRSLQFLIDLGNVWRQVPFGESPRSTKLAIYRLADSFLRVEEGSGK